MVHPKRHRKTSLKGVRSPLPSSSSFLPPTPFPTTHHHLSQHLCAPSSPLCPSCILLPLLLLTPKSATAPELVASNQLEQRLHIRCSTKCLFRCEHARCRAWPSPLILQISLQSLSVRVTRLFRRSMERAIDPCAHPPSSSSSLHLLQTVFVFGVFWSPVS